MLGDPGRPDRETVRPALPQLLASLSAAGKLQGIEPRVVATALEQLCLAFPFHIAGIHSDNGSEFINHHLARWCTTRQITFTRGRATRSNDQAHIEQKNWSVVRRAVGYYRYDTPRELDLLNQLWPLENLLVNLFCPNRNWSPRPVTARK